MKYFIFLLIVLFYSCANNQSRKEQSEKQFKEKQKEQIISELNEKYDIVAYWDTLFHLNYTIEFQEKYRDKLFLLNNFFVHDIYIEDENYHIVIETPVLEINLDLLINENDYKKITIVKEDFVNYITDVFIVFKIYELKKNRLDYVFIGEGEIIEVKKNNIKV